jgi:hypothetical protein
MVKLTGPLFSEEARGTLGAARPISSSYRRRLTYPTEIIAPPPPPPPPTVYVVTGTINPNATGNFHLEGTYNGKPYYARLDHAYFLAWGEYNNRATWVISDALPLTAHPLWFRTSTAATPPTTTYNPAQGATGTATVAAGP